MPLQSSYWEILDWKLPEESSNSIFHDSMIHQFTKTWNSDPYELSNTANIEITVFWQATQFKELNYYQIDYITWKFFLNILLQKLSHLRILAFNFSQVVSKSAIQSSNIYWIPTICVDIGLSFRKRKINKIDEWF